MGVGVAPGPGVAVGPGEGVGVAGEETVMPPVNVYVELASVVQALSAYAIKLMLYVPGLLGAVTVKLSLYVPAPLWSV